MSIGATTRAARIRDLLTTRRVTQARLEPRANPVASLWSRSNLSGRLIEISATGAGAPLTAAVGLVRETQVEGDPVAWVSATESSFFPPDVADNGVDLASLVVVRAPDARAGARAAERLIRSGAFGLVVIDFADGPASISTPMQGRLVGLAQKHDTALVCLTVKARESSSIGSMVSLRVEVERRSADTGGGFRLELTVLKDKQRGPGWRHAEVVRGPAGLR